MQKHPVTHAVQSIDFLRVSLDEKVRTTLPIHLEGEPEGVKVDGGILVQALHDIEVECLPQDTPEFITVDVSGLEFNGAPIHVKEITLPAGIVAITDGDTSIAVVNPPDVEPIVEAEVSAEAVAEVEAAKESEEEAKEENADKN
jgi:large subunit ribosomal protein L25